MKIEGKVTDKISSSPIRFAVVKLKEKQLSVRTGEEGEYEIKGIEEGNYTLEVSAMGYIPQTLQINLTTSCEQNFSLFPSYYFDLKTKTPYYTKMGIFFSLLFFVFLSLFLPERKPNPYRKEISQVVQTIELPPQLKELKEPPPPPKPQMPVAAESEAEVERETIDQTTGIDLEKTPPPIETDEVYEIWVVEEQPKLLMEYYVQPEYPEIARKGGIEGEVLLELIIDTSGYVIDVKVYQSLFPPLDEAAVKVAPKWRYKPARQGGRPVKVRILQPVRFQLK